MTVDTTEHGLERVIALVCETGQLSGLTADEDFYDAGFSSLHSLQLLLDLERDWGVTIPDDDFIVARSARSLSRLVAGLREGAPCS